jgi:hypothetical protein
MEIKSQGLSAEVRSALARVAAHITMQAQDDPGSIDRLAGLFDRDDRERELFAMLLDLVPSEVDADVWLGWLDGGVAVPHAAKPTDPDAGRKTSARGAQVSAARKKDEAQRQVAIAEAKLAEAQAVLAEAEEAVRATDRHLRQVVAYRMLADVSRLTAGVFAMGPAWTLMRSISGYIRPVPGHFEELDPEARAKIDDLVASGKADSAEMLDLLDLYAGDVLLELRLRAAMLSVIRRHHEPVAKELEERARSGTRLSRAAKRLNRKREERNTSVRANAGVQSDRHDVLAGLVSGERQEEGES